MTSLTNLLSTCAAMPSPSVERQRDDFCFDFPTPNLHIEDRIGLRIFYRHIPERNRLTQTGRFRAARYATDKFSILE